MSRVKTQAPKGRNITAQGNALGNAAPEDQSPEGATQPKQTQGYDELGNALPPSAIADSELPTGWQWVRVHEVGAVQLGRQRAPKHENGANMRPYLRVANVFEDRIDLSDVKTMNFTPSEFETFELKPNDILLNEGQSLHLVGRPALYRGELPGACFQNTLVRFRPGPRVDPKFALTIFRGYMHTGKFQKIARWTTNIAHLGASRFAEMPFPLPPLDDQRRIVAEIEKQFTRLEAGVAALRRVQANLKRYRAAVLKAASEGRLVPTEAELARAEGRPFESGQQLLARILTERRQNWQGRGKYKEPETPDISNDPALPEGWTYASVETVGFVQLGRQRSPKHHAGQNMRPYLRVANVYEDRIDLRDVKEMNFTPEEFEVFKLVPNDILLNEGQSLELVGRPAIYRGELPGACFTNTLVRFRPCPSLGVRYALSVFRAYMHSGRFQKIANWTTNIAHLGADRFAKLPFPLPPLAEQTRIVAEVERRLSVVEELEAVVTTNLQRATRLRQAVLAQAFNSAS